MQINLALLEIVRGLADLNISVGEINRLCRPYINLTYFSL